MKENQAYFLSVTYFKMNNPEKIYSLNEYHFNKESANRAIQRLEFLGYTIEDSALTFDKQNYAKIS